MYVIRLLHMCLYVCIHKLHKDCYFLDFSNFLILLFSLHFKSFYRSCSTRSLKKISNGSLASFVSFAVKPKYLKTSLKRRSYQFKPRKRMKSPTWDVKTIGQGCHVFYGFNIRKNYQLLFTYDFDTLNWSTVYNYISNLSFINFIFSDITLHLGEW